MFQTVLLLPATMYSAHVSMKTGSESIQTPQESQVTEKIDCLLDSYKFEMRHRNTSTQPYNRPPRRRRENELVGNDDRRSYDGGIIKGVLYLTDSRPPSSTTRKVPFGTEITHPQNMVCLQNDSDSSSASSDEFNSMSDWYPTTNATDWLHSPPLSISPTSSAFHESNIVSEWYPTTDANGWLHSPSTSPTPSTSHGPNHVSDCYPTTDANGWFHIPPSSTSPTPSVSNENAVPTKKRRPRSPETCRKWLQGRCERGYNCLYVHGDLEYEDPLDSNPPRQNKPLFSQWSFTVHDHIKVRVGPGLAVESVTTGFETPWIHITGLPPSITTDEFSQLLQKYGAVSDVKVHSQRPPIIAAKARFSSYAEAQAANTGLDGTSHRGNTISTRLSLSTTYGRVATIDDTAVKIRWEAPSKQAYAGYPTLERAEEAIKITRLGYSEKFISAQIHVGIPAVGRHTVHFRNLPIKTEKKHMANYAQPEDVMWEKVNYTSVDYATNGLKKLLEYNNIQYLKFDVLPPPYRDGYVCAWAHFKSSAAAKAAVGVLHHYKPLCTGKTRVFADHVLSLSYGIPLQRYLRAVHEVDDLRATLWQRGKRRTTLSFFQHENSVTVKLSATDVKELGELKVELERVLGGETVCLDGTPIWDGYFNRIEGHTYLRQLEVEHAPVTILESPRSQRLILFGHSRKRALVSQELLRKYKEVSTGEFRCLSIPGHLMGPFMGRQFGALRLLLGPEKVTLDKWGRKLCIRGKLSDFRTAQQALDEIRAPSRAKATSCPICLGEVELPIVLSCRHSYCRSCLSNYLLAAKDNRYFPLSCLGHNAKCSSLIPLSVVRDLLPITDFDALVEAAFTAHIDTHPEEFHYCPSPDCTQVYRPAGPGTVLQCPSCLMKICPRCHVEYHEGFDCPEKDGGDRLFERWAREHGIKHCPGCKIPIERTEGCNHVTCTRCQSHICWVCMETFPRGEGIYSHMRAEHGGIGV